ncbi:hypothetical protein THAOC_05246 [Thalassiosira oceanica]|uniref:Uncharacterized protein n=1 Tax=Thalassiosira oceanica TaxID=159749 RepID=K0T636_THAOC|nr:hypothetical protein THAOC_05246 [Thalassiosira oceanica]|eukprot:EJK73145.1 hypothetical protein THAOC_05246 [Thalassiosira oceanica]
MWRSCSSVDEHGSQKRFMMADILLGCVKVGDWSGCSSSDEVWIMIGFSNVGFDVVLASCLTACLPRSIAIVAEVVRGIRVWTPLLIVSVTPAGGSRAPARGWNGPPSSLRSW